MTSKRRYSLLVFDWDGTIIDSASTIAECIRLAAADLGLQVPTKEQASHVIGLGLHDALRHAVPGLPPERTAEFVERYREHFRAREHEMDLFAGMRELLELLHAEKILGIATGKSRRGLDRSLEATGLKPYFRAARAAGVDALAVTYGAHAEEGLRSCQPRACVSSVAELSQWLNRHA